MCFVWGDFEKYTRLFLSSAPNYLILCCHQFCIKFLSQNPTKFPQSVVVTSVFSQISDGVPFHGCLQNTLYFLAFYPVTVADPKRVVLNVVAIRLGVELLIKNLIIFNFSRAHTIQLWFLGGLKFWTSFQMYSEIENNKL